MKTIFLLLASFPFFGLAQNIYTPNGTLVPTASYFAYNSNDPNFSTSSLNAFQSAVANGTYGSSCQVISGWDRNYNCHGYAWNMFQINGRTVALDQPNYGAVSTYINDNSFVSTSNTSLYGVRVRYSGDHSAVVTATSNRYLSKWGAGPLVKHAPGDVYPTYYSPYAYYQCNFQSYVTSAQLDGGTVSYGTSPSFIASTGSHSISVSATYSPNYSFSTYSVPGVSIYAQSGNNVYFDKNAYNQQGKYIIVTLNNGCATSSTQASIYIGDPSGARMAAYPSPASSEVNVKFQNSLEASSNSKGKNNVDEDWTPAQSLYLYDDNNNMIGDYSNEATQQNVRVDVKHLKSGTYYLKAIYTDGKSETKRFMVK